MQNVFINSIVVFSEFNLLLSAENTSQQMVYLSTETL